MQSIRTSAGIDVSAKTLAAARRCGGAEEQREFANDPAGHRQLLKWIGRQARVAIEATGVYHLQLALTLRAAGVEVTVVNPRVAKDFSRAMANRSKTDKVDARTLLEYLERMPLVAWQAPTEPVLELRELGRRLNELVHASVAEKNRAHARGASRISRVVMADVKAHIAHIGTRIDNIEAAALRVIKEDARNLDRVAARCRVRQRRSVRGLACAGRIIRFGRSCRSAGTGSGSPEGPEQRGGDA
jgi:transposase